VSEGDEMRSGGRWDDIVMRVVSSPPRYETKTESTITFFEVVDRDRILGYLWAADDDKAASFMAHEAVGPDAFNASIAWRVALRSPKARGLGARAALEEMVRTGGPEHAGTVDVASRRDMADLAELKALAKG
jgi:hypothetical protein